MQESELIKPKQFEVDEKTLTSTYGRFAGEPFERGFGTTLGSALRRILLSSLPGAAITKVKIDGVVHEFSTIRGVTEDVTDLLLNLKQVRFRIGESAVETGTLSIDGSKKVAAKHLSVGPQVEILNPDAHIAQLGKDGRLELEVELRNGRGYVTAERNQEEEDPVGTIPLDAVFSPVRKVNVTVTNARVGQRTDYERLTIEVWTDGSVGPKEAVTTAAQIVQDQLVIFAGAYDQSDAADEGEVEERVGGARRERECGLEVALGGVDVALEELARRGDAERRAAEAGLDDARDAREQAEQAAASALRRAAARERSGTHR